MKFFDNRILNPVGNAGTFDEWVQKELAKMAETNDKVATMEAKPECDGDSRGACRGQVINNDNEDGASTYQKGESVDGKPDQAEGKSEKKEADVKKETKEAHCGKDMGECNNAGDVTEDHSDASSASEGKDKTEQFINNDPNYQKGESTDPGKLTGKNKKDTYDPVAKGKKAP
jgi:hypothetical protein